MNHVDRFSAETYIGEGNSVFVKTSHLREDFPLHWHNYFEIEIITGGRGIITVNGNDYDTASYRVFLLTPVDFHQLHPSPELKLLNISFDARLLSDRSALQFSAANCEAYPIRGAAMKRLLQAVALLRHECNVRGSCQGQLCEYILECLFRETPPMPLTENEGHLSGIQKAVLYLEMHFKENISLDMLAREAGFNPTYFSELFRKTTGQSYKQRLTELRIRYAKTLLKNGVPVSRVCFECGFGSLSNFTAVFKQAYGVTPRQYQQSKQRRVAADNSLPTRIKP